jgi:hypothetical protein
MKYTGKYKQLADQFRADGCDEAMVERFIREEMERDEFEKNMGTTDLAAYREWQSWPERRRQMYLGNAFCPKCSMTSFAPGFTIRKDRFGLIVEGKCTLCGSRVVRCCD